MAKREKKLIALADGLHGAAIRLLRGLRRVDVQAGVTGPKLSALSVLVFAGPQTLKALAAVEQVRAPTMTRLVQELERASLVVRKTDAADKRVAHVSATAKGRRMLEAGRARRLALLTAAIAALPAAECRQLAAALPLLQKLSDYVARSGG